MKQFIVKIDMPKLFGEKSTHLFIVDEQTFNERIDEMKKRVERLGLLGFRFSIAECQSFKPLEDVNQLVERLEQESHDELDFNTLSNKLFDGIENLTEDELKRLSKLCIKNT